MNTLSVQTIKGAIIRSHLQMMQPSYNPKKRDYEQIPLYNNRNLGQHLSPPFKTLLLMVGIDKLNLYTPDYDLKDSHPFNWTEKYDSAKKERTKKYWYNSKGITYDINHRGLIVQCNPSKFKHEYHLSGLSGVKDAIPIIQKDAKEHGLTFDIERMKVSRLDLAKQNQMDNSFMVYAPVFRSLDAKYSPHRRDYGSTFMFGNRSRQTCIYDKLAEVKQRRIMKMPERNLMRMETRYMGSRLNKKVHGFATLQNLLDSSDDFITSNYTNHIEGRILTIKPEQFDAKNLPAYEKQVEYMKQMHKKYNRKGWAKLWVLGMMQSSQWMFETFGDFQMIDKIMDDAGLSKKQKQRARKEFKALMELPALDTMKGRDSIQIRDLYTELVSKFVA